MKPTPHDVCDRVRRLCEVHSTRTVSEIVGIDRNTILGMKRRGWKAGRGGRHPRKMPTDFPIMANRMTKKELQKHYKAGQRTVSKWAEQIPRNYERKPGAPKAKPIPDDVAEVVARLGPTKAAAHFQVDPSTLQNWRVALGLPIQKKRSRKPVKPTVGWVDEYVRRAA